MPGRVKIHTLFEPKSQNIFGIGRWQKRILSMGQRKSQSEISAVRDVYRKFMCGIIICIYTVATIFLKYMHLLCSLVCIAYQASHWMLNGANVYQGSLHAKRKAKFIN